MANKLPEPVQARSRVKSVYPTLKDDGTHGTYLYLGKTYYQFVLETELGHRGRAASAKEKFRWDVGDMINYTFQEDPIHGDRIKNITVAEEKPAGKDVAPSSKESPPPPDIDQAPKASSRYVADPHKQSLIVAESCIKAAVRWASAQNKKVETAQDKKIKTEDVVKIAAYFEKWIYDYEKRRKK